MDKALEWIKNALDTKTGKAGVVALVLFGGLALGQTDMAFDIYSTFSDQDPREKICKEYEADQEEAGDDESSE